MLFGRGFRRGDDEPGAERVVILGHALWQSRYRGDRGVLGLPVRVNGEPADGHRRDAARHQVPDQRRAVGVGDPDRRSSSARRDIRNLTVFARLKPGVDRAAGAGRARRRRQAPGRGPSGQQQGAHRRRRPDVQRTLQRRPGPHRVPDPDGRGRLRAADRLRQRRQPAAVALDGSGRARSRCATRWARRAGAWCGSCWSRACCSASPAASSASASPSSARGCSIGAVADVGKPYWIQFTIDGVVIAYLAASASSPA